MATSLRWTSADLESLPTDGKRYEIIDGDLCVSKQPHFYHQEVCLEIASRLKAWSKLQECGRASFAPGVIFAEDDDVVPDVVWISNDRLANALGEDGKLHAAPELAVEVLSPGAPNEQRDRDVKPKLYSRRGVLEYWIVDWRLRQVEVYRRENSRLHLAVTLTGAHTLEAPLLPEFTCSVDSLFEGIPSSSNQP